MKRPITVISIISIFLFIVALTWFGIGIYEDGKSGSEQNERVFETLVFKTMNAANSSKIGTPDFSKKFIDAVGNIENYSSLKLDVNGKPVYSYPPAGFSLPSAALTNSFKKTTSTYDGFLVTVSASMYAIKTNSVYYYAKFAFVLIFLGTSISLLLLLILSRNKNSGSPKIKNFFTKKNKSEEDTDELKIDFGDDAVSDSIFNLPEEENIFDADEDSPEEKSAPEKEEDGESTENGQPLPFATDITEDNFEISEETDEKHNGGDENSEEKDLNYSEETDSDLENQKAEETEEKSQEYEDDVEGPAEWEYKTENEEEPVAFDFYGTDAEEKTELDEEQAPEKNSGTENANSGTSFFDLNASAEQISPATGLKLQSAVLPELNEKIKKSLENGFELTLALLKVNGLDRGNLISNKIVEILKEEIKNPDEIYEYNSDGYAIILKNEDLSSCADIFDGIYEKITSFLKENNSTNEVVFGLSSVNKRNVDANRLATESEQALEHALEDPDSPIIAFRANPEKYKEYLDKNLDKNSNSQE